MTLADRLGVNVHMGYPVWYAARARVQEALDWLGVKHVRDMHSANMRTLTGVSQLIICETAIKVEQAIAVGAVAVEGPNEANTGADWETRLRAAQAEVYRAAASRVPVLTPSLNPTQPYATLGQVPADVASLHVYRNAIDLPGLNARLSKALTTEAAMTAPGKPVWVTETGWHDDTTSNRATTPATSAAQLGETLEAFWAAGVARVYLYELWDEPDRAGEQGTYGLFTSDWTPKPIAYAVRDLLAPPVITRRTRTGVDARCSRCPGVMVLWADRDKHTSHLT